MNATFSFVPTPSALDTSTGSWNRSRSRPNRPPNDPISERTPFVKVDRASERMRRTVSLPASMSTPAALYSMRSEVQFADERLHQRAARRALGRIPVGAPHQREEALLVEILFEHVEPLGDERDRRIAIGALLEERQHQRRIAQRDGAERKGDRRARGILRRTSDLDQRSGRLRVTENRERAEPRGRAAQQLLVAGVLVGELQRVGEEAFVRLAID